MTSVKSPAARFNRLKNGHVPTRTYLKRFGHQEDPQCRWCTSGTLQTWENLFHHSSRWKVRQKVDWKAVGQATGWKAGRCRHVNVSELFSVEACDQVVMVSMGATDMGTYAVKQLEEYGQEEHGQDERGQD